MLKSWVLVGLLVALCGCCTPEVCKPENLPYGGDIPISEDDSHQAKLFELLQYAARKDCCEVLHAHLSEKTRDKYGSFAFCTFWKSIEIPEYEYRLVDVIKEGEFSGTIAGTTEPGEEFAYVSYPPEGKPGKNLLAQILLVTERDTQGREVLRIGLMEQVEGIEAGDFRYTWDAGQ